MPAPRRPVPSVPPRKAWAPGQEQANSGAVLESRRGAWRAATILSDASPDLHQKARCKSGSPKTSASEGFIQRLSREVEAQLLLRGDCLSVHLGRNVDPLAQGLHDGVLNSIADALQDLDRNDRALRSPSSICQRAKGAKPPPLSAAMASCSPEAGRAEIECL